MSNAEGSGGTSDSLFGGKHNAVRTIGSILIEEGRLRPSDMDKVQRFAVEHGMDFCAAAVQLRLLRKEDIEFALELQFEFPTLPLGGKGGVAEDVVVGHDPMGSLAEAIRALRSQLMYRWLSSSKRSVLAVVSPDRGEGRSWLAANLATAFAQIGKRTLLIDADLRHSRQHELFNLDNSTGFSALLTGGAGTDVAQLIHPRLRLYVLPAGRRPPNPQELLARSTFEVVLQRCIDAFDLIILDTPAAAESADTQILAAHACSALLVARRNHTRSANLCATMHSLQDIGVDVVGSVINEH